jgi:hypothetical protein
MELGRRPSKSAGSSLAAHPTLSGTHPVRSLSRHFPSVPVAPSSSVSTRSSKFDSADQWGYAFLTFRDAERPMIRRRLSDISLMKGGRDSPC